MMRSMIRPFIIGFATTFKHMFKKPITVNYPDEKVPVFPKYRGQAGADARRERPREVRGLRPVRGGVPGRRHLPRGGRERRHGAGRARATPSVYQIHKTRCIFCGYCEEACPVSAIFMGKDYELAVYSNKDFIWDKTDLLVPASAAVRGQVARRRMPWSSRRFSTALDRRVLVCDGAMGTMLYAKGIFLNRCFDELNLTQPDLVAEVHHDVRPRRRGRHRDQHVRRQPRSSCATSAWPTRCARSTSQGARIARQCRARRRPASPARSARSASASSRGARPASTKREDVVPRAGAALVEGGVDLFILETFRDLNEIGAAIRARAQRVCDLPIVAQMTTEEDGNSLDGTPPEAFAPELERARRRRRRRQLQRRPGGDARDDRARWRGVATCRSSAQPNAGQPRDVEGRNLYLCSPEYMASLRAAVHRRRRAARRRLLRHDARAHPADRGRRCATMAPAARAAGAAPRRRRGRRTRQPVRAGRRAREVARWRARSRAARFVVVVELRRRAGSTCEPVVEQARRFRDLRRRSPSTFPTTRESGARVSALALAVLVEQQAGVETMLHYSCRDRNLLGMQSDLLGAHAMGVRNLLLITGRPAPRRRLSRTRRRCSTSTRSASTNMVSRLNHGLDIGGQPIGAPTAFHIGVAVNPFAPDLDAEWRRLDAQGRGGRRVRRHAAGLRRRGVRRGSGAARRRPGCRSSPGSAALESLRHAEFMANEVPGVACRTRCSTGCAARRRGAREALALTRRAGATGCAAACSGLQITSLHGIAGHGRAAAGGARRTRRGAPCPGDDACLTCRTAAACANTC